jgi:hypothetical protein
MDTYAYSSDSELTELKKAAQQKTNLQNNRSKLSQSLIFYDPLKNIHKNFDKTFTSLTTRQVITERIYGLKVQRHRQLSKLDLKKKAILPTIDNTNNSTDDYYDSRAVNLSPLARCPTIPKIREENFVIDYQKDGKRFDKTFFIRRESLGFFFNSWFWYFLN